MVKLAEALGGEGTRVHLLWRDLTSDAFPAENVFLEGGRLFVVNDAGSKVLSERYVSRAKVKGGWWKFVGPDKVFHVKID